MLVLRLVERVPPLFVRELLLRLVVPLRAVEPDGRFVLEPLPLRVLVVRLAPVRVLVVRLAPVRALVVRLPPLRVDVFRVVPLRERADEPVPLDVVRLREEVEPPVFRPVVEPVRHSCTIRSRTRSREIDVATRRAYARVSPNFWDTRAAATGG